ncbi:MAG: pantetheine-phosphate adenylyltransferase [Parachlamydiales bacterium]|jgi:pantetheine-phosphate adenylyltransferase
MEQAVFPGTFNPPTIGHLDIIERASKLVKTLYVAVGNNPKKSKQEATIEKRLEWLKLITSNLPNVQVVSFEGLLADFARINGIKVAIRSIRGALELEQETMQAKMNKAMTGLETLFIPSDLPYISSSLVREVAVNKGPIEAFVPYSLVKDILIAYS